MATQIKQQEAIDRNAQMAEAIKAIQPVGQNIGPLKALFYARNKVGKTRLGASSGLKTLVISTDPYGTETLDALRVPNVDKVQITKWEQFEPYYWYLATQDHDYEVVVIDTWSMLTTMCLRYVMGQETNRDPLMPKGDHYQKLAQIMNNEVMRWVYLPIHVIFLAQERNFTVKLPEDEDETLQQIGPATSPAVAWTLIGAVGTVGHLYKKEVIENGKKVTQRRMRFDDPSLLYICGTRVRGLPTIMANPTLKNILDIRAKTGELPPDETLYGASTAVDEEEEEITQQEQQQQAPEGAMAL